MGDIIEDGDHIFGDGVNIAAHVEGMAERGLELSVSYGFIKEHGGDIRVESKWGSGTSFTISLPIKKNVF